MSAPQTPAWTGQCSHCAARYSTRWELEVHGKTHTQTTEPLPTADDVRGILGRPHPAAVLAEDIDAWHADALSDDGSAPDCWDECDTAARLAAWLIERGWRKSA